MGVLAGACGRLGYDARAPADGSLTDGWAVDAKPAECVAGTTCSTMTPFCKTCTDGFYNTCVCASGAVKCEVSRYTKCFESGHCPPEVTCPGVAGNPDIPTCWYCDSTGTDYLCFCSPTGQVSCKAGGIGNCVQ